MTSLTVGQLLERMREPLELEQLGEGGLDRAIQSMEISSPGLVLAGYLAAMALFGVSAALMKPAALAMNIVAQFLEQALLGAAHFARFR